MPDQVRRAGPLSAAPPVTASEFVDEDPAVPVVTPQPAPEVYAAAVGRRPPAPRRRPGEGRPRPVTAGRHTVPVDISTLLRRLAGRDCRSYTFATAPGAGRTLLGASPELLVARRGDTAHRQPPGRLDPAQRGPAEDTRRPTPCSRPPRTCTSTPSSSTRSPPRCGRVRELTVPPSPPWSAPPRCGTCRPSSREARRPVDLRSGARHGAAPDPGCLRQPDRRGPRRDRESKPSTAASTPAWSAGGRDRRRRVGRHDPLRRSGRPRAHPLRRGGDRRRLRPGAELAETAAKFRTILQALGL